MKTKLFFLILVLSQFTIAQQSPHGKLAIPCMSCHTPESWTMKSNASFNHDSTGFVLQGRHKVVACSSCHTKLVFEKRSAECSSCHTDVHKSELGNTCLRCHTMESWIVSDMKQKHQQTRFPLLGKHALPSCEACHNRATSHRYAGTPLTCIACHKTEYQQTTNPNHAQAKFKIDCTACHAFTSAGWKPASFDHSLTAFALTGKHRTTLCQSCHTSGNYNLTYTSCVQCHLTNFQQTTNPNHATSNLSQQCQTCHTTNGWTPASFNHSSTAFALTGKHSTTPCQDCHKSGNYNLTYSGCVQCHLTNFQQTTNPNHVTGQISQLCQTCHSTTVWSPSTFSHSSTAFALSGKHLTALCQDCHKSGNYNLAYSGCVQCHLTNYQQTTNPNHVTGQISQLCQTCHSTTVWSPSTFSHSSTAFALSGKHLTTLCQDCHKSGNYNLTYSGCVQCHLTNFQQTTNPNHVSRNISQICQTCHTTNGWSPASFDHTSTNFQLTGSHVAQPCNTCHTSGNYQLTYTGCYQCHSTNFQNAVNPNHVTNNFSHTCETCHNTTLWSPSTFIHSSTNFTLTGKHTTITCISCHTSGNYQLTYTDCYQCHQTDFSRSTKYDHVTLLFNHNCTPCHTTTVWLPSTFNHDLQYFKIYSAKHNTLWSSCSDCHSTYSDYTQFTCFNCHKHNQTDTDNAHQGVTGYQYTSPKCYSCHRNI